MRMDGKSVLPDCINASNPYHECVDYCSQRITADKARAAAAKLEDNRLKAPPAERTVHRDCVNASDPYHECENECFRNIIEARERGKEGKTGLEIVDEDKRRVATLYALSSPQELERLNPFETQADNVVINFKGEWQVIPAENLVAAFQRCSSTILAISTTSSEAQVFLEALEQGLGGVVLKVEDTEDIMKLKEYFDRRNESANQLSLTKARVTRIEQVGMGDRVCVDLCSLMQPGEGLLVGSFARGLFLVHSECLESNYIASWPFRVNAGPVHAYIAVPGGRTCYLSELHAGKEVTVVDQSGSQ